MSAMQSAHFNCRLITAVVFVACAGARGTHSAALRNTESFVDGSPPSGSMVVLERIQSSRLCGGECTWEDGLPWSERTEALAARVREALIADFIRSSKMDEPSVDACAPGLASQLRSSPRTLIYVSGDVPDRILRESGFLFQRASAEEYERIAQTSSQPVGFLEIVIDVPSRMVGTTRIGIPYSCENRTPDEGIQGRSGVALERDEATLWVTRESTFDQ